MDPLPQPPLCILGCCNVRTWTLTLAYIYIVCSPIAILFCIIKLIVNPELSLVALFIALDILMGFIFFILSIRLRSGVLQRKIAPILCWLQFCIIEAIIGALEIICYLYIDYSEKVNALDFIIAKVILLLWIYPVYVYYCFEKNLLEQNRDFGQQII